MPKIKVDNVSRAYGKIYAINDFNFVFEDGKFYVIVGPSGCGKSTLLKLIAGLEKPTTGKIFFDDKNMDKTLPAMRNVSMMFQDGMLFPHLTVRKNIEFPLKIKHVKSNLRKDKVSELAKMLNIYDLLDRYPDELSGGQRQRAALGRVLVRDPSVFLFDEPLSSIDTQLKMQIREMIYNIHTTIRKTFIYVTHDQSEALSMADLIVVMNNGKILQAGLPEQLYNDPDELFVAQFLGEPAINIISENFNLRDKNYSIGIRPEKMSFSHENKTHFLTGSIDHMEFLGDSWIYFIATQYGTVILKDYNSCPNEFQKKENLSIYINQSDLLVFDFNSNKRIREEEIIQIIANELFAIS